MKHHWKQLQVSCFAILATLIVQVSCCLFFLVRRVSKLHLQSSNSCWIFLIFFDLRKRNKHQVWRPESSGCWASISSSLHASENGVEAQGIAILFSQILTPKNWQHVRSHGSPFRCANCCSAIGSHWNWTCYNGAITRASICIGWQVQSVNVFCTLIWFHVVYTITSIISIHSWLCLLRRFEILLLLDS